MTILDVEEVRSSQDCHDDGESFFDRKGDRAQREGALHDRGGQREGALHGMKSKIDIELIISFSRFASASDCMRGERGKMNGSVISHVDGTSTPV